MKILPSLVSCVLGFTPLVLATDEPAVPEDLSNLVKAFPAIYWHASDQCLRETSPSFDGQFETIEEFLGENIAKVIEFDPENEPTATIQLVDPDSPEENWQFVLTKSDGHWKVTEGWKCFGQERSLNLFKGDIFLGSMEPFVVKEIGKFYQGEKFPPSTKIVRKIEFEKSPNPAPSYNLLFGEGMVGTGFHFRAGEKTYIACSLHQFDGEIPKTMESLDIDDPILISSRVYQGNDIQVLNFQSKELSQVPPLTYSSSHKGELGDAVYCYNFDKPCLGHIQAIDQKERTCSIKMQKPFSARGKSGSPVILAKSGTVIGVVLTADSPEGATTVGFELLAPKKQ